MQIWRAVVEISHPALGGIGTNTWHAAIDREDGGGVAEAVLLKSHLKDFYDGLDSIFPDTTAMRFDGVFHGVGSEDGIVIDVGSPWVSVGGVAGGVLPPALCLVAGWRTDISTNNGRGRTFLGPIAPFAAATDGTPTSAAIAAVVAAADELIDATETHSNEHGWGVYSKAAPEADPPRDEAFHAFTSVHVRNKFGVLRSRRD